MDLIFRDKKEKEKVIDIVYGMADAETERQRILAQFYRLLYTKLADTGFLMEHNKKSLISSTVEQGVISLMEELHRFDIYLSAIPEPDVIDEINEDE